MATVRNTDTARILAPPKVDILGVHVSRVNLQRAVKIVRQAIETDQKIFVAAPNVYIITTCNKDENYRKAINAANIALPDGMPLVWASYLLSEYTGGRASGADFFEAFHPISQQCSYSNYYLGGGPGGSENLIENLLIRYPDLRIVGNFSPPMGEHTSTMVDEIVDRVNEVDPDVLWVGTGAPRQEHFIHQNICRLKCRVAIGVGAAFYYGMGKKKRAPRWMTRTGLEWSYRIFVEDPTLFWTKRYYAYLWEFVLPVLYQVARKQSQRYKSIFHK